jgi:glycosyltransferase involved in cell wall biosynthesis
MPEPLVSVKMLTYNHAPFIAQAIEGVLQQKTNFPFELVIGEDCSTDNTREIVFEYQKKYPDIIRVVTSDRNVGMNNNGLRTLHACQGKYIAFCEGDDYWHNPGKLQKQVEYLEGHPECGLVYSSYDVYLVNCKKKIIDYMKCRRWKIPENPSMSHLLEGKGVPLTCTVVVRGTLYEQIVAADPYLHQSGHFLMGDTPLWAEMATKARLHYIPESLATYNITDESATRSKDVKKTLRFSMSNSELMLYLCNKYDLPQQLKDKFQIIFDESSLKLAFHARNKELADDVRRKKKTFTFEEWLLYCGARNSMFYYLFHFATLFRNVFRKKNGQWT